MQVDLTTRKLKALARRLEKDLALTVRQRRKTLDALARGFGHDSFPALKASVDAAPGTDQETRSQDPSGALNAAPDEALTAELRARGHAVVLFTRADVEDFVDLKARPDWLAENRAKLEDQLVSEGNETLMTFAQMDGVLKEDDDPEPHDPDGAAEPFVQVEYDKAFHGGGYSDVGAFAYVPLSLIRQMNNDVEAAFTAHTGISSTHIVHYTLDELYNANGERLDEEDDELAEHDRQNTASNTPSWRGEDDAEPTLRRTIARQVRNGIFEGRAPYWQVALDDPDDPDLRELAAERIEAGANRDADLDTWRLDCDALDTQADDPDLVRETVAGLIREGYTSGHYPHWTLHLGSDAEEDRESLLEHIASLIEDGYTSGYHPRWWIECAVIA